MRLRLRSDRLLIGISGLGLLRGWPLQDPDEAAAQIEAIAKICAARDEQSEFEAELLEGAAAFSSWSASYDPSVNPLIAAEEPVIRDFLEGIAPGRALDVAAGTGRLSKVLGELGHDVVALDWSLGMLKRARDDRAAATFACGDLRRLPFANETFDLVVCGLALTHVPELGPPVAEIARLVRPGGRVILSDLHPVAAATGAHAFFEDEDGSRVVVMNHVHWPSEYLNAFQVAGLALERLIEPLYDRALLEAVPDPDVRSALGVSVVGLPFALVWLLRRPAV